jgi:hypothetical protein
VEESAGSFVAECFWPDVHPEQVDEGAARARLCAEQLTREGTHVDFTGSILMAGDDVVFFLFDGVSADAVHEACERAAIQYERIVESVRGR